MDTLKLHLITYNVASVYPSQQLSLLPLLQDTLPDLVLVGFQEVNSQPQAVLVDTVVGGDDPWTASARNSLSSLGYVKVRSIRLLGIVLSLYSLEQHVGHLRGLETQYTRLGFKGYWGNKGTVSIRFKIYGVSICVLNSHLAAHDHNIQARVESYNTVLGSHTYSDPECELIMYHDFVFWMGDLNFRLEENTFSFEEIDLLVSKGQIGKLLAVDQLTKVRTSSEAFGELSETLPTFVPTFKYKIGSSVYDAKRRPAWTDRILYKVNRANYDNLELSLQLTNYDAHSQFMESDHKPVTSNFNLSVFSPAMAQQLLLNSFGPIVHFFVTGEYFLSEDISVVYEVKTANRKYITAWDWIGLFRADVVNLEDYVAFTWAPSNTVREGVFETVFDDSIFLRTGTYRLAYFSSGSKNILGFSPEFLVRSRDIDEPEIALEANEEL